MFKLNENYYLRKCYLEREQVPTQSVMKNKMSPPLANVYFKSMTPKLKVLAGLEPPMKGGGNDWFVAPEDLLKERAILKPVKKEYLSKLGYNGIRFFGEKLVKNHKKHLEDEKTILLQENDINWKKTIETNCRQLWENCSKEAAKQNTRKIQQAFHEFTIMYTTSISKIELLFHDATIKEIKRAKEEAYNKMSLRYKTLLKHQATMLYDKYNEQLLKDKANLKAQFIKNIEESRSLTAEQIHDINVEKHTVVEKLRNLLECQNLACQVYVALKEREKCNKEIQQMTHEHAKKVKVLTDEIAMKDFEIRLAKEKERNCDEFMKIWQKKVCEVVKRFQLFVVYCLNTLPEHADFFIDMEKLMLLQLNEALENPSAESIFVSEQDESRHTPVPRPHPFFLFCDKGYKPRLEQNLCPKHCTSSASQLPVIVVNKRCIYAACDNFDMFTDKIKQYIHGQRGDDEDLADNYVYEHAVPVKFTSSKQLLELKLESSLFQIIQNELSNVNDVPLNCCICNVPYCFCNPLEATQIPSNSHIETKMTPATSISSGIKIETASVELAHEREPKWESFMNYMDSKKCKCSKKAKRHLKEHLPVYMRKMSTFDSPDLPNYEKCSLATLKKLVKRAQGKSSPPLKPEPIEIRTKDASTQYTEPSFDYLCNCFSDFEIKKLLHEIVKGSQMFDSDTRNKFAIVDGSITPSHLTKNASSFATERAYSLKNLIDESPQLVEIFRMKDCNEIK
ncbi:uncharacterized protein LOC113521804 [Galleria mellonella]|uniref:Uncharacterized protein LOC113521804 n=1 Tax=Galleria mellonella TaxID=7137 RepID=A0A6J1X1N1_GALME|nr:uncharacterized protein LOC113521804 [Galleria mellonella]